MLRRFDGKPLSGRLVYRRSERSFDVEPQPERGVTSLLVNDVQIEIDEDGRLIYVWGLCPHESWTAVRLDPPTAKPGRLQYVGGEVVPGVSKRLNADKRWAVGHDTSSQWLCIGDQTVHGEVIAFAPGAVAVLREGKLGALWLHPDARA
ncbi:hypothetical protein [Hydrocarboniphaga sp.]|uniref:hypothetical protein n=1 Tax=Hydrocarboniphaga sp. TaxID=2033016 RepID=UPI003D0D646A